MEESNPMLFVSSDKEKGIFGGQAKDVFHCNICMDPPTNAILTSCGHVFCWSCIHQWLETNKAKPCPVCKDMIFMSSDDEKAIDAAQAMDTEQHALHCNICMEDPTDSILTTCSHLFCQSCLDKWLQNKKKPCPVYQLMVESCNIIPVYGCQGGSSSKSSDNSTPPSPSASLMRGEATPSDGDLDGNKSEVEEIDAREYNRALQAKRLSRPMGR